MFWFVSNLLQPSFKIFFKLLHKVFVIFISFFLLMSSLPYSVKYSSILPPEIFCSSIIFSIRSIISSSLNCTDSFYRIMHIHKMCYLHQNLNLSHQWLPFESLSFSFSYLLPALFIPPYFLASDHAFPSPKMSGSSSSISFHLGLLMLESTPITSPGLPSNSSLSSGALPISSLVTILSSFLFLAIS